jgi:hypothetical protein
MYAIFRDSKRLDPLTEYFTEAEAFGGLHRVQPHSVDHATKHEGYSIRSIPGQVHVRKYTKLCAKFGVKVTGDEFAGKPRGWWREKAQDDWTLNNTFGLKFWDSYGCRLWGRLHFLNVDGEEDNTRRGMSEAEASCCYKHAVWDWALRGGE